MNDDWKLDKIKCLVAVRDRGLWDKPTRIINSRLVLFII